MAITRHEKIAERIVTTDGLAFALATKFGNAEDLREARELLKTAICNALADELLHGAELQRRSSETNAQIDELEKMLAAD